MKPFSYFLQWVKGKRRHAWRLDLVRAFPEVNRLCAVANAALIGRLMSAAQYLMVFINYKTIQPFPSAKSGSETCAGGFIIGHAKCLARLLELRSFAVLQFCKFGFLSTDVIAPHLRPARQVFQISSPDFARESGSKSHFQKFEYFADRHRGALDVGARLLVSIKQSNCKQSMTLPIPWFSL